MQRISCRRRRSTLYDHLAAPEGTVFQGAVDDPSAGGIWVHVPRGSFIMGSPDDEGYDEEHPAHKVTISRPFQITATLITNEMYSLFDPSHDFHKELAAHPVADVTWFEAMAFAGWLKGCLPTEAQWEYACRAGTSTTRWCDEAGGRLSEAAWFLPVSSAKTYPVATKAANPIGLFDVYGNTWEWCLDAQRTYTRDEQVDPRGALGKRSAAVRGGSSWYGSIMARSAVRSGQSTFLPPASDPSIGFRVIRSLDGP